MRLKLSRNCTWPERSLGANASVRPRRSQPLRSQEMILRSPFQGLLPRLGLGLPLALSRNFGANLRRYWMIFDPHYPTILNCPALEPARQSEHFCILLQDSLLLWAPPIPDISYLVFLSNFLSSFHNHSRAFLFMFLPPLKSFLPENSI